jgi:release factor glutamine methyltransferase
MNLLTVGEALKKATDYLESKGRESSRLSAELLLARVLGTGRLEVYLRFEASLKEEEIEQLRSMLSRRAAGEPVAYILGQKEFMGLTFEVSPAVLIPRPETEHLVGTVLKEAGENAFQFLDVGIGSGCIAVSLLHHRPQSRALGVDTSSAALSVAAQNAENHKVGSRLQMFKGSLYEPIPSEYQGRVDWIVSNPPYIRQGDLESLAVEIREYEPREALGGGEDGLEVYRPLIAQAPRWLKAGGGIALEISNELAEEVEILLKEAGFANIEIIQDYAGHQRVAVGWMK